MFPFSLVSVGFSALIVLVVLVLVAAGIYWAIRSKLVRHRPHNQPDSSRRQANKTVIVCAGDSITHGVVSANYVDMVETALPADQFQVFNAGINADLTYTLLRRLDTIIALQPDVVTVLIGTNDINATLGADNLKQYRSLNRISPDDLPSFETYQANYRTLVHRLKTETSAQIALLSLPVMSEDLSEEANLRADRYSAFVRQLAETENLTYLPVRERMVDWLRQHPKPLKYSYDAHYPMMTRGILKNQLLGRSWDQVCADIGQDLTYDQLHLNTRGAGMIAELVTGFINLNR